MEYIYINLALHQYSAIEIERVYIDNYTSGSFLYTLALTRGDAQTRARTSGDEDTRSHIDSETIYMRSVLMLTI